VRGSSADIPAISLEDWRQLNAAIDTVAALAGQASRIADRGANERLMFKAFDATFAYMVQFLHHLTMDRDNAHDALAKAAALSTELTTYDMDTVRAFARRAL
jgi:hypothetical protein